MRIYTLLPLVHTYTSHTCLCMSIKSQIYARDFHINALLSVCLCPTHTHNIIVCYSWWSWWCFCSWKTIHYWICSESLRPTLCLPNPLSSMSVCVFIVCMYAQAIPTDFDLQPPQVHNECSAKKWNGIRIEQDGNSPRIACSSSSSSLLHPIDYSVRIQCVFVTCILLLSHTDRNCL